MDTFARGLTLETDRLLIRPFVIDDLDRISAILDASFGAQPPADRRFWLEWAIMNERALAMMQQPPYGDRALVLQASGDLIGSVGLVPSYGPFDRLTYFRERISDPVSQLSTPEVGLFWVLDPAHRSQGYATEAAKALIEYAFLRLSLKRVVATTEYGNHSSINVMKRLGMVIERNASAKPAAFQVVGILENPEIRRRARNIPRSKRPRPPRS